MYFKGLKTNYFIKSKEIYGKVDTYWDKLAICLDLDLPV